MRTLALIQQSTIAQRVAFHLRTPLYRNGYLLTLSSFGSAGFGLVFWALATHYYPAEIVGLQSAALSAMMLLAGLAVLGLNNVLLRYIQQAGPASYRLIGITYAMSAGTSVVISLVFLKSVAIWFPSLRALGDTPAWTIAFVLATAAWCIFTLQDYALTGLRQAQWIPLENILFSLVKVVLLVVLARWLAVYGIFAAWNIPVALSILPINWLIFRYVVPQHVTTNAGRSARLVPRQVFHYATGNYLGTLFSLCTTNLLPIAVATLAGAKANAYFYLPWMIVTGLQLLALNMTTSLTVEATIDPSQLRTYCRRIVWQILRLLAPVVLVILLGAPLFLRLFGLEYAIQGTALLRWLALAALPNTVVVLGLSIARVQNRAGWVTLIQGAVCLLAVGASFWLVPSFGIVAVGWAWLASQTLTAVVLVFTLMKPILR